MTNTKIIYSSKIAGQLCRKGFKVIGTQPNPKKPWLDCFLFEITPEFSKALDVIMSNINSK